MMLPGAALAVFRRACMRGLPLFVVAYLGVWTVVGLAPYAFYRPVTSTWMSLIAGLVFVQKAVREHPIVDVSVALAIVGLGIVIVGAPSLVPRLEPTM
jgi:hypothetical protein